MAHPHGLSVLRTVQKRSPQEGHIRAETIALWGWAASEGLPLCPVTGKQAQRPLRESGPAGGRGTPPTPESRAERAGGPQSAGSAAGHASAHWDVRTGSAPGRPPSAHPTGWLTAGPSCDSRHWRGWSELVSAV